MLSTLVAQNKAEEAPIQKKLDECQAKWKTLKRKRKDANLVVHHKHSLEYKVLKQQHKEELEEIEKRYSVEDGKWQAQIVVFSNEVCGCVCPEHEPCMHNEIFNNETCQCESCCGGARPFQK